MLSKYGASAVGALAALSVAVPLHSQEPAAPCGRITRDNIVACALAANLRVQRELQARHALQGRRVSASAVFAGSPLVTFTVGNHTVGSASGYNWSASLSQEVELAGQRTARTAAVDAELEAQANRVRIARRDAAALAYAAYFDALAAAETRALVERLAIVARAVVMSTRARAAEGLAAPVEADLADAAATRANIAGIDADKRLAAARAQLVWLTGGTAADGVLEVEGALTPLRVGDVPKSASATRASQRPELAAAESEARALRWRAETFKRSSVPSPMLSLFAQSDPFEGKVVGAGVRIPLPIPGWSRTYAGDIAEASALAERAETEAEITRRSLALNEAQALREFEARSQEVASYSREQLERANQTLRTVVDELRAGRLAVRDAIVTQQTLFALLQGHLDAQRALCLASVEVLRAHGVALERHRP